MSENVGVSFFQKKRGRPAKVDQFPEIIPVTNTFLADRGLEAKLKNSAQISLSFGATNKEVRNELQKKVNGLTISESVYLYSQYSIHL